MNDQTMKFLSQIRIFASLPEKELERVAQTAVQRSFAKNAILFTQGRSKLDGIYILQSGEIELYYEREDHKTQISRLRRGEIFGGISVLMNSGISVRTAKAAQESKCYSIPVEIFLDLCHNYRFFNKYFVDAFGQRMIDESYASIFASNRAFHFLSGIAPFSFLPEAEIEKVAMELSLVFHPRDTLIFTQGLSKIESLHIIQNGAAERYFEEGDNSIDTTPMSEGDLFGGISMLINNSISIRSLKTTEDTHFYIWPKPCFLDACNRNEQFLEYFTDTFGKRMLDRSYASIVAKTIQPGEEALQFLNQPVSSITQKKLIYCVSGTSSILVKSNQDIFVGIVTDNDLRKKVIASGLDIQNPVEKIMSFPLRTISSQALVFEALMSMMQGNYKHLGVTGPEDELIGIITNKDILAVQGQSPLFLIREISTAGS
ncbi:MAG: cyclic nucleotide-binding domain-containing protein, partial [Deltaproteobacteria bacterium]|nr:cyclic nucleotide-binding domain-containing protein [Deltaproteobacteria bacterium]